MDPVLRLVRLCQDVIESGTMVPGVWAASQRGLVEFARETLDALGEPEPRPKGGTWPPRCVQRAFVEGACWWQFHANGSTAFGSERTAMEAEAVRRYGEPGGQS